MGSCFSIQISGDSVLDSVGSCLCGEGNHIRNLEKNLVALEKAMVELKATRDDVLTEVQREEAKENREKMYRSSRCWVTRGTKNQEVGSVERMSLMNNKIAKIAGSPKCPKLTTLFLQGMYLKRISGGIFTCMPRLVVLDLSENSRLTLLPEEISDWKELRLLKHLEVLTTEILSKLDLEKLLFCHMGRRCIQKVVIKDMTEESFGINIWELEEVVSIEKADEMEVQDLIPFGKLETLVMVDLPVVKSIYWTPLPFPCMREMTIDRCPKLEKLPLSSESVVEVERFVITCEAADWIEGVEWEDKATRLRFLPSRRIVYLFSSLPLCLCVSSDIPFGFGMYLFGFSHKLIKKTYQILDWAPYNYIHKYGYNSKLMSAAVLLQSLKDPPTILGDAKYSFVRKLSPDTATHYNFINKEAKFKPPKLNRFANETLRIFFFFSKFGRIKRISWP
ncbi:BnaC08g41470D [Brassica napus]|uniref:(rape) hypothetical protein n=1 Tax=Brassica napus TaxID=3708 RepID=A0A078FS84_BRANA|nr:unnamed protein product [Brassica napus]CDY15976.1 BnaC08g41470D [Brassica napus]